MEQVRKRAWGYLLKISKIHCLVHHVKNGLDEFKHLASHAAINTFSLKSWLGFRLRVRARVKVWIRVRVRIRIRVRVMVRVSNYHCLEVI